MVVRVVVLLALLGVVRCQLIPSCENIKILVEYHNMLRLNLTKGLVPGQPAAAEMKFMIWDDELAAKAAKWAANKVFQHNPDKTIPSRRFETGENMFKSTNSDMSSPFDPYVVMDSWWDEHKDFKYHPLTNADFGGPKKIGHYTQMAWSDSTRIGCGLAEYVDNGLKNVLVVCNYGPGGNYMGQTPYKSGKPSGTLICTGDCSKRYGAKCKPPSNVN